MKKSWFDPEGQTCYSTFGALCGRCGHKALLTILVLLVAFDVMAETPVVASNGSEGGWPVDAVRRLLSRKHILNPPVSKLPTRAGDLEYWLLTNDPFAAIERLSNEKPGQLGAFLITGREQRLLVPLPGGLLQNAGLTEPLQLAPETDPTSGKVAGQLAKSNKPFELDITNEIRQRYGSSQRITATAVFYKSNSIPVLRVYDMVPALTWRVIRRLLETEPDGRTPILDLRYCAGGSIYEALDFASLWFDSAASFATLVDAAGLKTDLTTTAGRALGLPAPSVVWTSRYTASACELLVTGLRYQQKVTVVGEATRGKCTVQSNFKVSNSHQIRFTSGYFTDPEGQRCASSGIAPNIDVTGNIHQDSAYFRASSTE